MRFSLRVLYVAVAFAAVYAYVHFGSFGLILILPHLALTLTVHLLLRNNRLALAASLAVVYLICWASTTVVGTAAADSHVRSRTSNLPGFHDIAFLKSDPSLSESGEEPNRPWCFVGNHLAPCPFVVMLDVSQQDKVFGIGETEFFAWWPGGLTIVYVRPNWTGG